MGSDLVGASSRAKKLVGKKMRDQASFCTSLSPELRCRLPTTTGPVTNAERSLHAHTTNLRHLVISGVC